MNASKGVLFYIYPFSSEGVSSPDARYSDSLENADLSFSIWSDAPTMTLPHDTKETKGTPVTLTEFIHTKNYNIRRLSSVYIIGAVDLSNIKFDNWTLYRVSIAGTVNISQCSFFNAFFYRSVLGGTMDEDGNWQATKASHGCEITFEQFSHTSNYQYANLKTSKFFPYFGYCRLIGLDLTGWDFSDRSLAQLELEECKCYSSDKQTKFKGALWPFDNGVRVKNSENIKPLSGVTQPRGPHYILPKSQKIVFPTEAVAEQLYETINYQEHDLRFMQIDLRDVNLSGTTLECGYVAVYPETVLEGAVIRNATFKASGDAASDAGITNAILYTTKSYRDHNLSGVTFECNLTGCDLSTQNLSAARFQTSDVSGADFTDAVVTRCDFSGAKGLTREQIEATWNYKMGNMAGIKLPKELEELAAK